MLYDLVTLKKSMLESFDTQEVEHALTNLRQSIDAIKYQSENISEENLNYIDSLIAFYDDLLIQAKSRHDGFNQRVQVIQDQISEVSRNLFTNNYELEERDGGIENIRNNRKITISAEVEDKIRQRISLYTNWKYPTLEIGCRDGEWTEHLVASDPLYIFDKYQEFLDSTTRKFPDQYQRRLRKYLNKDYNFSQLPQKQFGFVFSWGHFNYVSLDTITQVLKELKTLLRPGGVFLFSYNDGDTPTGAGMAENFAQSFIPKSILIPTCVGLGYEVVQCFDELPNISWIEIKNPGTLKTVKAHQVMGKIHPRLP